MLGRRHRLTRVLLFSALTLAPPAAATAQQLAQADRGPRFLRHVSSSSVPVEIDMNATPVLRRRVALTRDRATLGEMLGAIRRQTGLKFIYSSDLVPADQVIGLRADSITVAAALTEILLDAGVDVVFYSAREAGLVRRRPVQKGSIGGRVTDERNGEALVGAAVEVQGNELAGTTDADGRYRILDVPVGGYTVRARYIGYAPRARSVTVSADQEATADFVLAKSAQQLAEVVTTGTVVPTEVKALPSPVNVITAEDIERHQLRRTDQIFRLFVPSAVAWDLGESPEQTAITVRGASSFSGGTGVKVFVDGVEVASTTFTVLDPASIERVEIIRGPEAATIYGPGAIGGVMQVFTKKGDPSEARPTFEAQASAGLLESEFKDGGTLRQEYRAAVRGGTGPFGYNVGGSYSHTGEWVPEFSLRTPSVFGGAQLTQGPVTVEITGRYFATHQDIPNSPRLVEAGFESPSPRYEERHYQQSTLGAHLGYTPRAWWRHNLTIGLDHFDGNQYNTRARLLTPEDTLLSLVDRDAGKRSVAYNTSVTLPLNRAVSAVVTAGFDHFTTDDDAFVALLSGNYEGVISEDPAIPIIATRTRIRNTGWFGQAQLGLNDALFLTGGVRIDDHTVLGDENPVSPRAGVAYNLPVASATLKLRAGYGEAIRAPEALSRIGLDLGFLRTLPNFDLRAERQKGVDAGVDLVWSRGSVSATYYHQTAEDLIQNVFLEVDPLGVPVTQDQNAGKVRNTGLELEGAVQLGGLQATANYAYTSSKVRELAAGYLGELLPGDYVLEIPRHTAGASLALTVLQGTSISSGLTYVGKRTSYDYVALFAGADARDAWITYDAFFKVNLTVTQSLSPRISALLNVENLTNNNTGEQFDYLPSLGRITTVGLRARW